MRSCQDLVQQVAAYLAALQSDIVSSLESLDPGSCFLRDKWQRDQDSQGLTCVLDGGEVFERGGVNYSQINGASLPKSASQAHPELAGCPFVAMGVSLVLHPRNPFVPTAHANFRFFVAEHQGKPLWWFGGGYDLTPYYGFDEDCRYWHETAKRACDAFDPLLYPEFKQACDQYFYLPHRMEARGIGGLFFDDFNRWDFPRSFALCKSLGDSFIPAYFPIVKKRHPHRYNDEQRAFQLYRRGRYVEFNLLFDRGTKFGIEFGGRTESILMSLPPQVRWQYNWQAKPGTPEHRLTDYFLVARDWLATHAQ